MKRQFLFLIWWILVNGVMNYLALEFLLAIAQVKDKRYMLAWLAGSLGLTAVAVCFQMPWMFLPANLLFLLFARFAVGIPWGKLAAPAAILFVLRTFAEGFSDVILSYFAANVELGGFEDGVQIVSSILMDMFFFTVLQVLKKRYIKILRRSDSPYLYILLVPCAVLVLAVRLGLRLDSPIFAEHLSSFGGVLSIVSLSLMAAAALCFFVMIEAFCSIIFLAEQKQAAALLAGQLEGQRPFIEEVKRRSEQYAAWQHDIDNHLLVLAGFLKERRYTQAETYVKKLCKSSGALIPFISTGNAAVDILLQEKAGYARSCGIDIACDVQIGSFKADEMDLCIVFSNIMDNAICACMKVEGKKRRITLFGEVKAQFLLIDGRNTSACGLPVKIGTGLSNVKNVAEKYKGTMEIEQSGGNFRISVLLCSDETAL